MARHHYFWMVGLISLSISLTVGHRAEAQSTRKKTGQTPTPVRPSSPSGVGTVFPLVTSGAPPFTQNQSYNYHVYPHTFVPTAVGMSGYSYPLAANPMTYAFSYFAPMYVPNPVGNSLYAPFDVFTFGDGVTMPFVPRVNHEPPSPEATIEILMPCSDADLLVDGTKMSSTGLRRHFTSPALEPGNYTYQVTAVWQNGVKEMRSERTLRVSPGKKYFVDFNKIEIAPMEK